MKCIKVLAGVFPLTLGLFLCPMVHAQTQRTATAIATVGGGSVTDITLTDGGSGYPPELSKVDISTEIVKITGGNGKGAKARAFMNPGSDDGRIVSIQILEYGTGYTQPTIVQIESPSEVLARFQVPKIDPEKERREHAQEQERLEAEQKAAKTQAQLNRFYMICKTAALISLGYLIIATLFCRKANRERGEIVVDPNPQKTELVELQSFFNPAQQEEIVCRLEKKIKARLNSNA